MTKKNLKWILFIATPLFLLLPFSLNFTKYFRNIILEPQKTGISTLNLFDESRMRPVITEVWYPVDRDVPAKAPTGFWIRCDEARDAPISKSKSKYPLIMLSHGMGGNRFDISWLAEILASNGFIVAAMDHFGNTWNNKIPEFYTRPWERPKDISFVIDQLLLNSHFKDKIDENRIGFAGYSLGGTTGIWVAGAVASPITDEQIKQSCQKDLEDTVPYYIIDETNFDEARQSFIDNRVSAFVLMAPALGWLFDENSLKAIFTPILIVGADKDKVAPVDSNAKLFAKKLSKATLRVIPGEADHYVFLNRASQLGKRLLEPRFSDDRSTLGKRKIHEEIGKNTIEFFETHL